MYSVQNILLLVLILMMTYIIKTVQKVKMTIKI